MSFLAIEGKYKGAFIRFLGDICGILYLKYIPEKAEKDK